MARKKKHSIDGSIIDLLMTTADAMTATEIAKALGFSKAKDVTNRLLSLNQKGVVLKTKFNKSVFWSCESEPANVTIRGESVFVSDDALLASDGANSADDVVENHPAHDSHETGYTDRTLEVLYNTIATLQETVLVLRDELKSQKRLFNDIFDHIRAQAIAVSEADQSTADASVVVSPNEAVEVTPVISNVSTPYPANTRSTDALPTPNAPGSPTPMPSRLTSPARLSAPPMVYSSRFAVLPVEEGDESDSDDAVDDAASSISTRSQQSGVDTYASVAMRTQARDGSQHNDRPLSLPIVDYSNWRDGSGQPSNTHAPEYLQRVAEIDAKLRDRIRRDHPNGVPPSDAVPPKKKPLVAVVGDSILKRMSTFELRKRTPTASALVRPFVGATIDEMSEYLKPVLKKCPDVVLLHIGINDLSSLRLEDEHSILTRFDGLVKQIKECGAIPIISFVVCTSDLCINDRVKNFNKLLFDYCSKNLIIFIKHDNINFNHILRDGIHLNMHGSNILYDNIVNMINYAVPLCFGK